LKKKIDSKRITFSIFPEIILKMGFAQFETSYLKMAKFLPKFREKM